MSGERCVPIGGVPVQFPFKPYPSQIQMMAKIIQGIKGKQNCLLESPTGSGKSLALLCAALAWQTLEKKKQEEEDDDKNNSEAELCECHCHLTATCDEVDQIDSPFTSCCAVDAKESAAKLSIEPKCESDSTNTIDHDTVEDKETSVNDDDFKEPLKSFRTPGENYKAAKKARNHRGIQYEDDDIMESKETPSESTSPQSASTQQQSLPTDFSIKLNSTIASSVADLQSQEMKATKPSCPDCSCLNGKIVSEKTVVPKIYFGTRTHKQVAQICRELGKTSYKDTKMCILASREYMCIHPEVSSKANKNEECKMRLDFKQCSYFENHRRISNHAQLRSYGLTAAWDIEDLVKVGKTARACPYYASRILLSSADIVFCPYNYMADPKIRSQMDINLSGQILILDEAHNIEDTSREVSSFSISQTQINNACKDLQNLISANIKSIEHQILYKVLDNIGEFLKSNSENLEQKSFDQSVKVWGSLDMKTRLNHMGLGQDQFKIFQECMVAVQPEHLSEKKNQMHVATTQLLEGIFTVMGFMFKDEQKYLESYRLAVTKTVSQKQVDPEGGWLSKRRRSYQQHVELALNFWCLNPAVAFSDIKKVIRTIILTSGTLSPMESFQSELDVPFPIQLEANHVINNNQVWVGSIGVGPSGQSLLATYETTETFGFQDDLGRLIKDVCFTVPHGVLCFLTSYRMLDKLVNRWQIMDIWPEIQKRKNIICESRGRNQAHFDALISEFYETIEATNSGKDTNGIDGALLLAVCRGKVSEGLDFANSNSRAVITVGIPFPNFKDMQVELKRNYNNQHRVERRILSGSEWYEIQAYRAINQALGRCIRHRNDWGALLLIDERFTRNHAKYTKGLSKWIRNKVNPYRSYEDAQCSLSDFIQNRLENDKSAEALSSSSLMASSPLVASGTPNSVSMSTVTPFGQYSAINGQQPAMMTPCGNHGNQTNRVKKKKKFTDGLPSLAFKPNGCIDLTISPMSTSTPANNNNTHAHSSLYFNSSQSPVLGSSNDSLKSTSHETVNGSTTPVPTVQTPPYNVKKTDLTIIIPQTINTPPDVLVQHLINTGQIKFPPGIPPGQKMNILVKRETPVSVNSPGLMMNSGCRSLLKTSSFPKGSTESGNITTGSTESNVKTNKEVIPQRDGTVTPPLYDLDEDDTNAAANIVTNTSPNTATTCDPDVNHINNDSKANTGEILKRLSNNRLSRRKNDEKATSANYQNLQQTGTTTSISTGATTSISTSATTSISTRPSDDEKEEELDGTLRIRRSRRGKRIRENTALQVNKKQKADSDNSNMVHENGNTVEISCLKCGQMFLKNNGASLVSNVPKFIHDLGRDSGRACYLATEDNIHKDFLQYKSIQCPSGLQLNCFWSQDDGCSVSYALCNCSSTDVQSLIGVKVVSVTPQSHYKCGQLYLLGQQIVE